MEKRRAERHKKRLSIKFGPDHPDNIGFMEDISATGLRIKSNHVYKPGTVLKLELEDHDIKMYAEGIVTWAKKAPPQMMRIARCGMGISFLRIDSNMVHYFEEHQIN